MTRAGGLFSSLTVVQVHAFRSPPTIQSSILTVFNATTTNHKHHENNKHCNKVHTLPWKRKQKYNSNSNNQLPASLVQQLEPEHTPTGNRTTTPAPLLGCAVFAFYTLTYTQIMYQFPRRIQIVL